MTHFEWISVALSLIAILFIPTTVLLFRATVKWTRTEDRMTELIGKMDSLIKDKERVHSDMLKQMTDDRRATDRRLRWLEENVWDTRRRT